jgi:hypothetical protein
MQHIAVGSLQRLFYQFEARSGYLLIAVGSVSKLDFKSVLALETEELLSAGTSRWITEIVGKLSKDVAARYVEGGSQ